MYLSSEINVLILKAYCANISRKFVTNILEFMHGKGKNATKLLTN